MVTAECFSFTLLAYQLALTFLHTIKIPKLNFQGMLGNLLWHCMTSDSRFYWSPKQAMHCTFKYFNLSKAVYSLSDCWTNHHDNCQLLLRSKNIKNHFISVKIFDVFLKGYCHQELSLGLSAKTPCRRGYPAYLEHSHRNNHWWYQWLVCEYQKETE